MSGRAIFVGLTVLAGAGAASLCGGTAGAAPLISTDAVCLTPTQRPTGQLVAPALVVEGIGFSGAGAVTLRRGLREFAATADQAGQLDARLSVVDLIASRVPRVRTIAVRARDEATGANSAPLTVRVAPLAFTVTPARARPDQRVTFRLSGFRPGRMIHAHYLREERHRGTQAIGRATRPCGIASARRPQFPRGVAQAGLWQIQFDQSATYRPGTHPRLRATLEVYPD